MRSLVFIQPQKEILRKQPAEEKISVMWLEARALQIRWYPMSTDPNTLHEMNHLSWREVIEVSDNNIANDNLFNGAGAGNRHASSRLDG